LKERIIFGYDPFVIPFTLGVIFIMLYLGTGTLRILLSLSRKEALNLLRSIFSVKIFKTIKDILFDVLLHVKIFKRNILLGYMHASIAFGWFMLIFIGHIEVILYTPQRNGVIYYPVFFRYFVMETSQTLRGAFFFFLMDLFLLIVLSGIALAIYKRFRSVRLGMKRTTRHKTGDKIALWSLWLIFPLRLVAESFTADISGGSFLTGTINTLMGRFVESTLYMDTLWWAYSCALALFLFALPFSRYMHIPTEILLIFLRNAGIKSTSSRNGFAESEIYSCSSCGICIDACPMSVVDEKSNYTSVYLLRKLRRRKLDSLFLAEQCLMCGKCVELCPVEIDSCRLKFLKKRENFPDQIFDYNYLSKKHPEFKSSINRQDREKVLYYAGCMTHLTPQIYKSLFNIMDKAQIDYSFMDRDGSICCGRPLILAGGERAAKELIRVNSELIIRANAGILLLSCPICYKVFKENYSLNGVEVMHHSQYINLLIKQGKIKLKKGDFSVVYHDPCDLGRGSGVYSEPRAVISSAAVLKESSNLPAESICCGGSLASRRFSQSERESVTLHSLEKLNINNPEKLITACPLCLRSFSKLNKRETLDIAQLVEEQMI
jgi:Fe-S oxidoreductase